MRKRVTIGIVGCGFWGPHLIRNLRHYEDCQVEILFDPDEDRLQQIAHLYGELRTTTRIEAVVNHEQIDAVVVGTPASSHYEIGLAALLSGKHVYIEQPISRQSHEAEELVLLAERLGLVFMAGQTTLFSPSIRRMKEIIDAGSIGELLSFSSRRLNFGPFLKDVNVMWDMAPGDIAVATYVYGENPLLVSCQGSWHITPGVEDVTMMHLTFSRNRCAFIHSSWLDPKKVREVTVVGSERTIVFDDTEPLEKLRIYEPRSDAAPQPGTLDQMKGSSRYGDLRAPYVKHEEPLKLECRHFLDCIQGTASAQASARRGVAVVNVLESATESLRRKGAAVRIAPIAMRATAENPGSTASTNVEASAKPLTLTPSQPDRLGASLSYTHASDGRI